MVKDNGYLVPVIFGWLPDKSETSYKVFFYMIEKKLEEMGLELKVRSVLCDFDDDYEYRQVGHKKNSRVEKREMCVM